MAISPNTTAPGEYSDLELVCIFYVPEEEIPLLKAQGMTSAEIAERQRQRFKDGTLVEDPDVNYRAATPEDEFYAGPDAGYQVWAKPVIRRVI